MKIVGSEILHFSGRLQRAEVLQAACYYGHENCIENAKQIYTRWMANPEQNKYGPIISSNVISYFKFWLQMNTNTDVNDWNISKFLSLQVSLYQKLASQFDTHYFQV